MDKFMGLDPADRRKRAELQSHMEIQMEEYSTGKYWKSYNDAPMSGKPEQEMIHAFITQLKKPYQDWLDYWTGIDRQSNQMQTSKWNLPLFVLPAEVLAGIVISEIVNMLLTQEIFAEETDYRGGEAKFSFQKVAKSLGERVKKICEYRITKENFLEDWKKQSHYMKNWEVKRCEAFTKRFLEITRWKPTQYGQLGTQLLNLAQQAECVSLVNRKVRAGKGWKEELMIELNPDLLNTLADMHNAQQFMRIIYRPMIVPPVDHTMEMAGGVLDLNLRKPTVSGLSRPEQVDLDALNAMQRTEWAINEPVLEVMEIMYKNNWEFCNLPPMNLDKVSFPAIPDDADNVTKAKLIAERADLWAKWYKSEQKRIQMAARLGMARELLPLDYFYHAYTMDFRGRAYTTCTMLSPQSGDFDRGLIKFATPMAQTDGGRYWQKVALANVMDGAEGWEGVASDKATFDDRVAWVDANVEQLLYAADNPLECASLWTDNETTKKNPSFQRLASIIDFAQTQREGTTSYPVQLDGACNGSQHWSAIMRDPSIAELTNVVPVKKPQDLYKFVANIASEEMFKRAADPKNEWAVRFAAYWPNGISRKIVKRATMCDAYGITPHGIRKYAREEGHLDWVESTFGKEHMAAAVNELASLTIHGLSGAMKKSNEGKDFVRFLSDICSEHQRPMTWGVGTGFTVVHKYDEYVPVMSRSMLYNKKDILKVSFGTPSGDIDPKGAWNGVAPNYIHSHDAAHMRSTINGMVKAGVTQFSMIHDSFGCPAPQVAAMRDIIRNQFYDLHEDCWLVQTKQDVASSLGWECDDERLPDIPELGDLAITDVLAAEYLFG